MVTSHINFLPQLCSETHTRIPLTDMSTSCTHSFFHEYFGDKGIMMLIITMIIMAGVTIYERSLYFGVRFSFRLFVASGLWLRSGWSPGPFSLEVSSPGSSELSLLSPVPPHQALGRWRGRPWGPRTRREPLLCLSRSVLPKDRGCVLEVSLYLPGPQCLPVKHSTVCAPDGCLSGVHMGKKGLWQSEPALPVVGVRPMRR